MAVKKPESTTQTDAVPAREPWQIKRDHLKEIVKIGMTEDQVTKAAGDPDRTVSHGGPSTSATWQYRLGEDNWFDVRFDKSNRVAVAESDAIPIQ